MNHPKIIQGGMGAGVSNWRLARAVAKEGQLGVVSSVGLEYVFASVLQTGDPDGVMLDAIRTFPNKELAERVINRYYAHKDGVSFRDKDFKWELATIDMSIEKQEIIVLANYCEVYLAKVGHNNPIGINLLTKVHLNSLPSLLGAMIAGVDYVIMGAGIPRDIPDVLQGLSTMDITRYQIPVDGANNGEEQYMTIDPKHFHPTATELKKPYFLPIVSSNILAHTMIKRTKGQVDGLIIELPVAGGHNAPPRNGMFPLDDNQEPVYGEKDEVNISKIKELGVPFWLAGCFGFPENVQSAIKQGANGVQVGTLFAFCDESGFFAEVKNQVRKMIQTQKDKLKVYTDPYASPTGFPFKVLQVPGTLSDEEVYNKRKRVCNLGYLRSAYKKADGTIGYRCAAEPVSSYVAKGGDPKDTEHRQCLCNALSAGCGVRTKLEDGTIEKPIITSGNGIELVARFLNGKLNYSAKEVIDYLLAEMQKVELATK